MITELAAMIRAQPETIEALAEVDCPTACARRARQHALDAGVPLVLITGPWADPEL